MQSWDVARVQWIGRRSVDELRTAKRHSSLVIHFRNAEAANRAITFGLALGGHLHRTEKYSAQPVQCFNCCSFGHIVTQCKRPAVCGTCASAHPHPRLPLPQPETMQH
ncbi:hypothetical protein B0H14DRAFT_2381521 [Mycena olivaceomarginata]|nr:hypothetical protein B0H14DRAFT_2381521 [Mycena olivaceomarginata]